MRELQFFIVNYDSGDNQAAHPIYADGFGIVKEREQSQIFFRNKLNDKLTFVAEDYAFIMSQPFDSQIDIIITVYDSGTPTLQWHGVFSRTDCTINEVDGIIKVTPEPWDAYTDILNKLDVEFNLADLDIPTTKAWFPVPNVLQLYQLGQESVTNYWQGETWQMEVDAKTNRNDITAIGFYNSFGYCHVSLYGGIVATFVPYAFVRMFQQNVTFGLNNGTYIITVTITESGSKSVTLKQGGTTLGTYNGTNNVGTIIDGDGNPICNVNLGIVELYARVVSAGSGYVPAGDWATINKVYKYATPINLTDGIDVEVSTVTKNTPTPYGQIYSGGTPTGNYYAPPTSTSYVYLPLQRNYWTESFSIWLRIDKTRTTTIDATSRVISIADTYEIGDLVKALLAANGLTTTFDPTAAHSEFLYQNPSPTVTQWLAGFKIVLTAKSNIVNPQYSEPASKIPYTLGQLFDFLRNALNVYWSIDGGFNLHLEHILYYKNGGAYSGTAVTAYDLTQMIRTRNGKPWAFGQNEYQFEKYQMPEYVKWQWMDETDVFFDGSGFVCQSKYVQKGRTEEITVPNVTSNINKMLMQPDAISLDGMAVIFLTSGTQTNYSTFQREGQSGANWQAANGELAMWNLQSNLLLYDAPCDKIRVSGSLRTNVDYKRTKYNEVTFPAPDVDPMQHIKTNIGDGAIESVENNLISQSLKVKLKYGN